MFSNNLRSSLAASLLVVCSLLLVPTVVQAACNYSVNFSSNKTNVTKTESSESFILTAKYTTSGELADCTKIKEQKAYLYFEGASNPRTLWGQQNVNMSSGSQTVQFSVKPTQVDSRFFANPNTLKATMELWGQSASGSNVLLVKSDQVIVNVSGSTTNSGAVGTNVYFKDQKTGQRLGEFNVGDKIQILLNIPDKSQVAALDPSLTSFLIKATLGSKVLGEFTVSRAALQSGDQYFSGIDISAGKGFKGGANSVTVELWQAETNIRVSTTSSTLNVVGLDPGDPDPTPNPGDPDPTPNPGDPDPGGNGSGSGAVAGGPVIESPIKWTTLPEAILGVINLMLRFIAGIAVVVIIYGGLRMVASAGNPGGVKVGREALQWAIVGLVVALMAFAIVALVQNLLNYNLPGG